MVSQNIGIDILLGIVVCPTKGGRQKFYTGVTVAVCVNNRGIL